ncbi:hypothetical protein ACOI22_08340 [Glaciecola sp. 2405UD65-10]|uniref:hypothetical protein n=1 Tax=Glaciecola sp. 2405UD65-10 TaxID=3397244 RepID=UPI003B5BD5B5
MLNDELKRLVFGANSSEEYDLMHVSVKCNGNAELVFERIKECLMLILSVEEICEYHEEWRTENSYELLETWFKTNLLCDVKSDELCCQVGKVRYFSEERDWFWWAGHVKENDYIDVYLKIEGFPVSGFDNLRWLFLCCGATEVAQQGSVSSKKLAF